MEISPELEEKVRELQETQQQTRLVMTQRYQVELELRETERALDELKKGENPETYKVVGRILIRTASKDLIKELEEKVETLKLRLSALEKQEKRLRERLISLQDRLKGIVSVGG